MVTVPVNCISSTFSIFLWKTMKSENYTRQRASSHLLLLKKAFQFEILSTCPKSLLFKVDTQKRLGLPRFSMIRFILKQQTAGTTCSFLQPAADQVLWKRGPEKKQPSAEKLPMMCVIESRGHISPL